MKYKISPQYIKKSPITVTILQVTNPATYILRESLGVHSSFQVRNFEDAEDAMQQYYSLVEPSFSLMPLKDSIVVVQWEKKFYRARILSILTMTSNYLFKVFLLDYGKEISVSRSSLYEIEKDFLNHPFQAMNFKLLGLEPLSLVMSNFDMSMSVSPVENWDLSAERFLDKLTKEVCSVCIEVKAVDDQFLHGNLYMSFDDGTVRCINEELTSNKFAYFNENCWKNVQKIDDVIENLASNHNCPPVSHSIATEVMSCSKNQSPNAKSEICDIKVSFVRPSDGKIMAESSLMNGPLDLPPKPYEESLEKFAVPPANEISSATFKSPSKVLEDNSKQKVHVSPTNMLQKLRKLKSQSYNQSSSQLVSQKPAGEIAHGDGIVSPLKKSSPNENVKSFDENKSRDELSVCAKDNPRSPSSILNLSVSPNFKKSPKEENAVHSPPKVASEMLLKLQRLKARKLQLSEEPVANSGKDKRVVVQNLDSSVTITDKPEEKYENAVRSPPKVASEMLLKLQILKGKKLQPSEESVANSRKDERVVVQNLDSSVTITDKPEIKQENAVSSFPKVTSEMLLKLQRLKGKKLQPSEESVAISGKNERVVVQNLDSSVIIPDKPELNTSPSPSNSSPVSQQPLKMDIVHRSPTSPPKQAVDISKVKALYRRRNLSQNFAALEAAKVDESEMKIETKLSPDCFHTVPNSRISEQKESISKNCTEVKLSATNSSIPYTSTPQPKMYLLKNYTNTQSSEEKPQSKDFLMSSSPKSKRISKMPDELVSKSDLSPAIAAKDSSTLMSSSEILAQSLSESSPPQTLNSEILKALSDLSSDSDDILCTLSKRKFDKSDSFDASDINESYAEYVKMEHSESTQLILQDFSSLWEKQKIPALLIGTAIPNPVLCTEDAEFSSHLHRVLREINFYSPSCIQSVAWPVMLRSRCLIAIAPPHSGKTVAFVLPLVSAFTDVLPLPEGIGPIAIILCSSWKKAQVVTDLFNIFLGKATKIKIVTLCADGGSLKRKVMNLINGCDVLISTPFCLLQCFKKRLVNFSRCENFILDDGTTLMNQHKNELKHILLHFTNGVKEKKILPQIAIFAERWNSNFKLILDKLMSTPVLLFTSFLESAIFACIPINGHVCVESDKKKLLLGLVKDAWKVVISTSSLEDSVDVHHFLRCEDMKTYLVNEGMEHYIADEVIKDWKSARSTSPHCLVITDQALIKMCISDADCLVHYDIPHDSRLQFGNRFSCIAEHFKEKAGNHKCICHILITKSDLSQAPHLVQIIESSGGKAPQELKEICKEKERVENTSGPLCKYLKAFGTCKQLHCEFRHIIDAIMDKPRVSPCEGDILGLVTHVLDASHYYIRLLKYIDAETNKTVSLTAAYASIGFRLKDFYSHKLTEMEIKMPVIGEIFVMVEDDVLFYRIKVLDKVIPSSSAEFPKWKVLFLDEGWVRCYEKLKLYELTDQIELPRPLAVEVYVCNIMTPDSCLDWNPRTNFLVCDLIKGKEIHGKIVLCLGETLWLDPIVLRIYNKNSYINLMKVDKQIIDLGHAKENKNHLTSLQLACSGKVSLPRMIQPTIEKEESLKEQADVTYAFLECDAFEEVYVSSVISPHQLYIQRAKFVDCLDGILDVINTEIKNKTLKKNSTLCKGMHCIAPFHEDNRYYRAVITDIRSDTEVHLFYADFGDSGIASGSDIYCIPPEHLRLPFQAIECELAGIAAAHGGWTDSAADTLYNLTRNDEGDMKILQLKAYSKVSGYKGGNHYVVDLWHNGKNLSQQLLDEGFGIPAEIPTVTVSLAKSDVPEIEEKFDLNDSSDSDSEIDPEEKDAAALFYGVLSGVLQPTIAEVPNVGPALITEVNSDDETSNSVSNTVAEGNLKNILPKSNSVGKDAKVSEEQNKSVKPLITWWDTPQQLNILINLKGVKVYELSLTEEELSFKTILAGIEYSAVERFYGKVHSSDASVYKTAQGVNIVAKKYTPFKWPRLVQDKRKFLHIKYDLLHIEDSEDEGSGDVNENYEQNIQENEYPMEESTSDTDNEEKYVQPWKKAAQYKDPYNLLE